MSVQEKLIKASHMISMDDIVREGNETLRTVADEVSLPLSDEDIILGEKMMEFLRNSQNPTMAEKMQLRPGVGLAANQLDTAKKIIAVLIPNDPEVDENGNEVAPKEAYKLAEIMYNAKIVSHSVQDAAIESGEGCLSVDREVPGLVIRHARVTVEYYDKNNEKHKIRLKDFPSMCVQHEIDHTNGIMFYDHINEKEPWAIKDGLLIVQ
ncbi:peptide deformylase [Lactococcus garvieae]|uniref:Peptide deformylase n=1 Tax=Lactococcus garvieae TaxID=1363 RepID=A0AA46TUY1_9LACT|nr:peptide deformylase [Lactococcus garvieae]UYT09985.1 peptide deformylase [Lactococcus garvieae]UYT11957.1 peptide deformylase [Lactococcus garvieae]